MNRDVFGRGLSTEVDVWLKSHITVARAHHRR
jgi:hypothetical protein